MLLYSWHARNIMNDTWIMERRVGSWISMYTYRNDCHELICNVRIIICFFHAASFLSISRLPYYKTVGQRLDVVCSVLIRSDVDPNSVKLSWRNKEHIVTADSRVTIITSSGNNALSSSRITTTIRFDPLFEDDEGKYTCYASINGLLLFESIQLKNLRSKYVSNNIVILITYLFSSTISLCTNHCI